VSQFPQTASGKLQQFMLRELELRVERPGAVVLLFSTHEIGALG
jgi:hypothetical protein